MSAPPKLTVLYLLYNAESAIPRLLEHLLQQEWGPELTPELTVEAWFVDDGSKDHTLTVLKQRVSELKRLHPDRNLDWIRIRPNPQNLGLAGSLNTSLKQIQSPYVLTCHLDCYFQTPRYLEGMVRLMEADPKLAAITGKPCLDPPSALTLAQKINTVVNLMDVLPVPPDAPELSPVGFAEGRCDLFRMSALREIGFYPESLRTSGEDQILAARLRARGWTLAQALRLNYILSTSSEQDTLVRIGRHLVLFGQTQFQILASTRGSLGGAATPASGKNRRLRMQMRLLQLGNCFFLVLFVGALVFHFPSHSRLIIGSLWGVLLMRKWQLAYPQLRLTELDLLGSAKLFLLQFYFDLAYAWGVVRGLIAFVGRKND